MNCESHEIEIRRNFGERCERKKLLICGLIRNICEQETVTVRVNGNDKFDVQIYNKQFKQIISLKENFQNLIEILYCNVKVALEVLHVDTNSNGVESSYDIQPLYLIPKGHNGHFQTTSDDAENSAVFALQKIDLLIELSKIVISSRIYETFQIERSFRAQKCQIFNSTLHAEDILKMNQWQIYDSIADDIIKTFGQKALVCRKFVVFLSCTHFQGLNDKETISQANIAAKTFGDVALGGGFLCVMGSGCLYSIPSQLSDVTQAMTNKRVVDLTQVMDNSNYRRTYGGCFATSLGSLIHEMGHIFDLAHTNDGLMGNDIDFVNRFFLVENVTEILPKRNVKNCSLVEASSMSSHQVNQKLTKIRKPGGDFMDKYHEQKNNEMTFFEENCMITLFHHKWMTQNHEISEINFDSNSRLIESSNSNFALIEIRKKPSENSLLIKFWSFHNENVNKFTFPSDLNLNNLTIFAITRDGNIFKN